MTRDEKEKRQAVIDARRRINALDINQSTSGIISVRPAAGDESTRCAPYATCVYPELSQHAMTALDACLLGRLLLSRDEIERVRLKMVGYGHANA